MPQPEDELFQVRLDKLARLRAKGIDPYPRTFDRTHLALDAVRDFEANEASDADDAPGASVSVAGRIVARRGMGKASFLDLLDGSGKIQAMLRGNTLGEAYELLSDIDIGDWIGVSGPLFRTRSGEVTVEVQSITVLSKSLRPLPEKWHGLSDVETRFRQRYLDLIANPEARQVAIQRSQIVSAIRRFMDGRGFLEVETPMLVQVAAGGMAYPFETHHNALDRQLFLRIATELHLKRLIVGGLEKVYEIGRIFRNEGIDINHNPEFTTLESYESFADYGSVMQMVEELVYHLATEIIGAKSVPRGDDTIDFTPPWPRLDFCGQILEHSGIDIMQHTDIESLKTEMELVGVEVGRETSWGAMVDKLLSAKVEPHLVQPCFLVDYPVEMSPLAKKKLDDPRLVERFEAFAGSMEIANAFTELNDPVDQRARFEDQERLRSQLPDEEWDRLDEDFLVAIEHGMPPTGGLGIGIDRLTMLLTGQRTIREVVLFPQLRGS
ncbi:MAG: lysine--tRNA ligase [Dehalococcoidia bacterium]|nr:lysine--tRNA ligase [Dehalococcoidia bacterium]